MLLAPLVYYITIAVDQSAIVEGRDGTRKSEDKFTWVCCLPYASGLGHEDDASSLFGSVFPSSRTEDVSDEQFLEHIHSILSCDTTAASSRNGFVFCKAALVHAIVITTLVVRFSDPGRSLSAATLMKKRWRHLFGMRFDLFEKNM